MNPPGEVEEFSTAKESNRREGELDGNWLNYRTAKHRESNYEDCHRGTVRSSNPLSEGLDPFAKTYSNIGASV